MCISREGACTRAAPRGQRPQPAAAAAGTVSGTLREAPGQAPGTFRDSRKAPGGYGTLREPQGRAPGIFPKAGGCSGRVREALGRAPGSSGTLQDA